MNRISTRSMILPSVVARSMAARRQPCTNKAISTSRSRPHTSCSWRPAIYRLDDFLERRMVDHEIADLQALEQRRDHPLQWRKARVDIDEQSIRSIGETANARQREGRLLILRDDDDRAMLQILALQAFEGLIQQHMTMVDHDDAIADFLDV